MKTFSNQGNAGLVIALCDTIHANADLLSQIDGAIGDGDHGVNMNKGFLMAKDRINAKDSFSDALKILADTLMGDIGGSMGPIYGTFFDELSLKLADTNQIDAQQFCISLRNALDALLELTGAKLGDKTLLDCLSPAITTYEDALDEGADFATALDLMGMAARRGLDNTRGMVAKIGRAARLGERTRGHLDAGASSCNLILQSLISGIKNVI